MVRTFKERFLRFQMLFPDFYHFHHVICGMKWAKKLKTKNGQNMSSGPFSHDAAQLIYLHYQIWSMNALGNKGSSIKVFPSKPTAVKNRLAAELNSRNSGTGPKYKWNSPLHCSECFRMTKTSAIIVIKKFFS